MKARLPTAFIHESRSELRATRSSVTPSCRLPHLFSTYFALSDWFILHGRVRERQRKRERVKARKREAVRAREKQSETQRERARES